ncbi:hypothetical protein NPIL_461441, partial [Nephila pilipes]
SQLGRDRHWLVFLPSPHGGTSGPNWVPQHQCCMTCDGSLSVYLELRATVDEGHGLALTTQTDLPPPYSL